MIIDTHCHFDMMPRPEEYVFGKERAGDIVIGMTNLPSHFQMGMPHVKSLKHIRLALGMHPLMVAKGEGVRRDGISKCKLLYIDWITRSFSIAQETIFNILK